MEREAIVVMQDGRLMAEIVRTEACSKCRACEFGQQERVYTPLPTGDYHEGEHVMIQLPDGSVSKASAISYGVPLVFLLIGLFAGQQLFRNEIFQALTALAFLIPGLLILRVIDRNAGRKNRYHLRVTPCASRDMNQPR